MKTRNFVLLVAVLMCTGPSVGLAQDEENELAAVTYGATIPVYTLRFERQIGSEGADSDTYDVTSGLLNAGAGAAINWNVLRKGKNARLSLSFLLFLSGSFSDSGNEYGVPAALAVSVLGNFISLGAGVDLYRRIGGRDTGVIGEIANDGGGREGISKENLFFLVNIGLPVGDEVGDAPVKAITTK